MNKLKEYFVFQLQINTLILHLEKLKKKKKNVLEEEK
jgi:hypothetical protein